MAKYILALDQGTSSSRAILFNRNGRSIAMVQKEFKQFYPKDGWVEHNPNEIFNSQLLVAKKVLEKQGINANQIDSIGITNQRETTIVWNRKTSRPIYKAIVWQDRRTAALCEKMKKDGLQSYIRKNTGLTIDAYFSATKIHWILNNVKGAKALARKGDLLFGTVDAWLLWKLTGGKSHFTDYSNASRTMLFNIRKLQWDKKILDYLGIPESMMPQVKNTSSHFGDSLKKYFKTPIAINSMIGDQQAALFGQACFKKGMAKNTYGTGCFMLMNTGPQLSQSRHGLINTIAWSLDNKITYALEGSVFIAGAAIQWLRDKMNFMKDAAQSEKMAKSVKSSLGVYFVPAFAGLGAPHWKMDARGAIYGLTQATQKEHIVRAALESLAFQSAELMDAMSKDAGTKIKTLRVDGGAAANNFLMQFQSDIIRIPVERPSSIESTARGAAYMAGIKSGFFSKKDLQEKWKARKTFKPKMPIKEAKQRYTGWKKAIAKTKI